MTPDEKINILMVDDQPSKLLSYEVILAELGENLIKASSATEALNILLKTDIAVVLMDVSMPDVDGFELADVIRQHPRFQKTAIIFISGIHLTDSDRIQGYRSGAVDYISVPVIPEVLRAKISIFAELHRKTRMLETLNRGLEQRVQERTAELEKSQEQYRMLAELVELASEAIMVRDWDGELLFWNSGAENMFGWRKQEIVGEDLHSMLKTKYPVSRADVEAALLDRGWWEGNLAQTAKDGSEIVVAYRKTLNRDSNVILETGRDITDQLRAEKALRETEKLAAMGRVAGIIAHEINNPLEAITNLVYLLRNHASLDDEARHCAVLAEEELRRVSHITRQTLSFYRESKQPIAVAIPDLVQSVLTLQQRALQDQRIKLHRSVFSPSFVHGFPVELRQVFLNLVGNSIQAMPEGGDLRVQVRMGTDWTTEKRGVVVSVVDTGTGIQAQDASRIFQPFFSTKSTKGTGLGLWISQGIVQKYSGRITFRSYRRGGRCTTCFRVFLPGTEMSDENSPAANETIIGASSANSPDPLAVQASYN
ncbi:MAG TPA: ATP-binding protein [Terracidiphilus sp.]|nr:ATP-binding protein [Terracidiphilus sp.]